MNMPAFKLAEQTNNLADQAAMSADSVIKSTQRVTNEALDSLAGSVQDLRQQAAPLLDRATSQASALAQRSVDTAREAAGPSRERCLRYAAPERWPGW